MFLLLIGLIRITTRLFTNSAILSDWRITMMLINISTSLCTEALLRSLPSESNARKFTLTSMIKAIR